MGELTGGSAAGALPSGSSRRWVVIVPVKPPAVGKSRVQLPPRLRSKLARAMAMDTVEAASRSSVVARVLVVSEDPSVVRAVSHVGSNVSGMILARPDDFGTMARDGREPSLDRAVAQGAAVAGAAADRAVLLADLPALTAADLTTALRVASEHDRAMVPDAGASGTTLLTARAHVAWRSAFGAESFGRHLSIGCVPLDTPAHSTLRKDVDTLADLAVAGPALGSRTAIVQRQLRAAGLIGMSVADRCAV